jgi:hypothetical protein
MSNDLDNLSLGLSRASESAFGNRALDSWGKPDSMSHALAALTAKFDNPVLRSDRLSVSRAVLRFRQTRELTDGIETKYVCIAAWDNFSGWCLLQDVGLLRTLLAAASTGQIRRRLKYFSCLLRSYLQFPRFSDDSTAEMFIGWVTLRDWLRTHEKAFSLAPGSQPAWLRALHEHVNLLNEDPCGRYKKELLSGGSPSLNDVFSKLSVPVDSWLRQEALFSQIQAGTDLGNTEFQSHLPQLIKIATGETEFKLSRKLSIRCVALLISRYAACESKPEHIALRDAALAFIGNPWLHRPAWDSNVTQPNGKPNDEARNMVNGWLKVRLIRDFFDLLSEDRSADGRRLNYWLRFEPMIEDMWFVLGSDAMNDRRKDYVDFRSRAKGRLLELVGATPTPNNAFLMRIGEHIVVEFGLVGNACFAYEYSKLAPDIKRRLGSEVYRAQMDIASLKVKGHKLRLLHSGPWESDFDTVLCPLFGFRPPSGGGRPGQRSGAGPLGVVVVNKPRSAISTATPTRSKALFSRMEFEIFASRQRLIVEDFLKKGGSLWVRKDDSDENVSSGLRAFGFTYKPGKGWWRE